MKTTYTVLPSDNFYTIAQKLYGSQRYTGLLLDANPGISVLQPGMELDVPESPDDCQTVYFSPSAHKRSQDIDKLFDPFDSDPDFPEGFVDGMFDDPLLNTPLGLALDSLFDDTLDDILGEVFDEQDHIDNLLRKIGWEEMLEVDFTKDTPHPDIIPNQSAESGGGRALYSPALQGEDGPKTEEELQKWLGDQIAELGVTGGTLFDNLINEYFERLDKIRNPNKSETTDTPTPEPTATPIIHPPDDDIDIELWKLLSYDQQNSFNLLANELLIVTFGDESENR